MASKAKEIWDELNERQQIYMKVIYDVDQSTEQAHRKEAARTWSNTPAHVWRRLAFNGPYSPIAPVLRALKVYDTGAGATLAALSSRGLIETETWSGILTDPVYVWITRAGRAAVRAGLGLQSTRSSKPRWALSEWLWREMVKVAKTGTEGLPIGNLDPRIGLAGDAHLYLCDGHAGRRGNRPYLNSDQYRWITYTARNPWTGETHETSQPVYYYTFTDEGRAHYIEHLKDYRELYPDIDAPDLHDPGDHQDGTTDQQDGTPEATKE